MRALSLPSLGGHETEQSKGELALHKVPSCRLVLPCHFLRPASGVIDPASGTQTSRNLTYPPSPLFTAKKPETSGLT